MANSNKAGTGKRVRRMKLSGNAAQGRGRALKSRPGSKKGMAMSDDANAEDAQPEKRQKDARADAKPKRNVQRRPVSDKRSGTKRDAGPPPPKLADKPGNSRAGEPTTKHSTTPPPKTKARPARATKRAASTGEAKRRKRTGGGFAGVKRAAPQPEG
jgi:hypothetical protein